MKVAENTVVDIHYTLTDKDGDVLDRSKEGEPLSYLHGANNIIDGLEEALVGRVVGDKLNVVVPPEKGYGERNENMVQRVPRSAFEGIEEIEVGFRFEAETDNGSVPVVVIEVDDESVVVDGNHPLAGETLTFDVEIVGVREADAEEIDHGHVH